MAAHPESPTPSSQSDSVYDYRRPATGKRRKWPLLVLLLAFILLTAYVIHRQLTAVPEEAGKGGRRGMGGMANTVAVTKARTRDVNVYLDALGTITPRNTVVVRSRVDGPLQQLYFTEGQAVKAGDLLAQIDPKPFEATLGQYAGQLARDQALLENALIDAERYKTLWSQDSISKQQVDTQDSLVRQYRGAIEVDKAQVDNARLQLGYTRITAPIAGRIGLRQVDPGNMIRSTDTNGIVTITQLQPITALFNIAEDSLGIVRKRLKAGSPVVVEAYDRSQKTLLAKGTLLTVDNQIDTTTGTVRLRALFDNKDEALFPNQFVNIKILVDVQKQAVVIPASGLQHGRNGDFVYVVDPKPAAMDSNGPPGKPGDDGPNSGQRPWSDKTPADKAAADPSSAEKPTHEKPASDQAGTENGGQGDRPRRGPQSGAEGANAPRGPVHEVTQVNVTAGPADGDVIAILDGLKAGDIVVTDGADKLKTGAKVRPVFAADSSGKLMTGNAANGSRRKHNGKPGGASEQQPGSTDSQVKPETTVPVEGAAQRENPAPAEGGAPAEGESRPWPGRQHGGHRQRSAE